MGNMGAIFLSRLHNYAIVTRLNLSILSDCAKSFLLLLPCQHALGNKNPKKLLRLKIKIQKNVYGSKKIRGNIFPGMTDIPGNRENNVQLSPD